MTEPLVYILILNFNRCAETINCLTSLSKSTYQHKKIIVLDHKSTDGSIKTISDAFPDILLINLPQNLGYTGNNNVGIRLALDEGADWVFILNEDTILDPDCLTRLVEVGESYEDIGVVGPMVYHYDEPTVIQSAGGILGPYWDSIHLGKNEPERGQYQKPHRVEWISGCAILVRRTAIQQAGMLDNDFFMYWEETEWCIRIGNAGWQIVHVPQAKLWHKGVLRNYQPKPSVTYYSTRNHLMTLAKHKAPSNVWIYTWFQMIRTITSWTIKPRWRSKREHRNAMFRGMVDFMRHRVGPMPSS